MSDPQPTPTWHSFLGHALTVLALALGGLTSFHALKAEVVELRATVHALVQTEAEHTRRGEAALRDSVQRRDFDLLQLREDIKELRGELRELRVELKNQTKKGAEP
jgi:hypothetical protein